MKNRKKWDSLKNGILRLSAIVIALTLLSVTVVAAERVGDVPTKSLSSASTGIITQDLNSGATPAALVNSLLGGGVAVSNVVFTGNNRAAGLFTGGAGIIGFENGVILSSGDIRNVVGPNVQSGITTVNGYPGDTALNSLIPGYTTYDSAKLEFDFVPTTSQMTFSYVFGSDEYNEYANTNFNDVFGFFVNGNSAAYNIALLPGVTPATPVSINNVNGGNPLGTNAKNPSFYRNNALYPVPPGSTINTELDGLTVVLTATANVNPGVTNHIKLAIADAGDSILDSDVFIQGGSVISLQLSLAPLSAENDVGESHTLTAKLVTVYNQPIPGKTITFTVSGPNAQTGTAVTDSNGIATWSYTGTSAGNDTIVATGEGQTSNPVTKKWIQTNTPPVANPDGPYAGYEGSPITFDGSASYDPDAGDSIVNYEWDLDGDSVFEANGVTVSKTWLDDYSGTVTLRVTDTKGATGTKSTTVTVNNVAPDVTVSPVFSASVPITLRIAGQGKVGNSVALEIIQDGAVIASDKIIRVPGSPNEQEVTLNAAIDLSKPYSGRLVFDTEEALSGGTPVWLITDGNITKVTTFNTQKGKPASYHQTYEISLAGIVSLVGKEVTFSGTAADPGTDDLDFDWAFGDGGTASNPYPWSGSHTVTDIVTHTYTVAGSYTVSQNVADDDGGAGSDTRTIVIS